MLRTPDEDFGILLEAAVMYDRRVAAILNEDDSSGEELIWEEIRNEKQFLYPRLLFIITGNHNLCVNIGFFLWLVMPLYKILSLINLGLFEMNEGKGPEKEKYEQKIKKLNLKRVAFRTMWLPAEDYPLLLGRYFYSICDSIHLMYVYMSSLNFWRYRIRRSWCLSTYFLFRVGSSNEGLYSEFLIHI